MPARGEHRRWNVTRLEFQAWRNFSRQTEIHLGGRAFFIGPNASGKSNILDALRFLREVAGVGLQDAVAMGGGMSEIRSLHTRRFPGVRIAVDVGSREQPARWSYELHFRVHPQRHVPVIEGERVCDDGRTILERPDDKDREDAERLTQTHLEQVSENQKFRVLGRFFESVRYLHIVPHVVREFRRDGDYRGDPFGSDFLEQIAATNKRSREPRFPSSRSSSSTAISPAIGTCTPTTSTGAPRRRDRTKRRSRTGRCDCSDCSGHS